MTKQFYGQITFADAISELKREIQIRERIYPSWIEQGKIKADTAQHRIYCLEFALEKIFELDRLERNQPKLF